MILLNFLFPVTSDEWKRIFLSKKEFYDNYINIKLNHALYPQNFLDCSVDSLKTPVNQLDFYNNTKANKGYGNEGIIGSFRKLEID